MKKILLFFLILLLSANLFAADFILAPDVGYQMNIGFMWSPFDSSDIENGYTQYGSNIGLTIGTITEKGFTFYWHTAVGDLNTASTDWHKQFSLLCELLFGKTFYFHDNAIQLGVTGGLNVGIVGITSLLSGFTIGPCISLNVDYFFAKQFGVSFSVTECPNYLIVGFDNLLLARFGAKFRL